MRQWPALLSHPSHRRPIPLQPQGEEPHLNAPRQPLEPAHVLDDEPIPADIVFDMVYNPTETLLLRKAADQGKTVIPGIQMFLEQAARQFETWTGETAPRAAMEKAAHEALSAAHAVENAR